MENNNRPPKVIVADTETYNDPNFLTQDIIERDYAESGNLIGKNPNALEVDPANTIHSVEFDWDQHQVDTQEMQLEFDSHGRSTDAEEDVAVIDRDSNLSSEQISLNKTVQKKIAKSQSKNITNAYCFIVLACVKFFCTIDEGKVNIMEARGELDANKIIRDLPLIQHIRNGNEYVRRMEIDEDAREAIQEALEIFLQAKNIQTSPEVNLLIAMATPVFHLASDAYRQKSEMNSLIRYAKEMNQTIAQNNDLQDQVNQWKQRAEGFRNDASETDKELQELKNLLSNSSISDKSAATEIVQSQEKKPEKQPRKRAIIPKETAKKKISD